MCILFWNSNNFTMKFKKVYIPSVYFFGIQMISPLNSKKYIPTVYLFGILYTFLNFMMKSCRLYVRMPICMDLLVLLQALNLSHHLILINLCGKVFLVLGQARDKCFKYNPRKDSISLLKN